MRKILLVLPLILLQGCTYDDTRNLKVDWKPHVERQTQSFIITFSKGGVKLSQSQKHQLMDAISHIPLKDLVCRLYLPDGISNNLTQRRLEELKSNLELYGLERHRIHVITSHDLDEEKNLDHSSIIVKLDQYTRLPHDCPSWDETMDVYISTSGEKNFGCSNALNTALMVDDPSTLIKGRNLGAKDATTSGRAVSDYQSDKVKNLKVAKAETQSAVSS